MARKPKHTEPIPQTHTQLTQDRFGPTIDTLEKIPVPTGITLTEPKPKPIGIRKLRARAVAKAAMEIAQGNGTLTDKGRELYPATAYPRQTVYRSIQQPNVQAEIKDLTRLYFDESYLRRKLQEGIEATGDKRAIQAKFLELAMRSLSMLTDVRRNENVDKGPDLSNVPSDQLQTVLLDRLRMTSKGPVDSADSDKMVDNMAEVGPKPNN